MAFIQDRKWGESLRLALPGGGEILVTVTKPENRRANSTLRVVAPEDVFIERLSRKDTELLTNQEQNDES